MSLHFVTGTAGEDHITGDDWGHLNAGIVGSGSYVLKTGNRLKATVASANSITISDGDAVMMGRHVRLSSPESVAIESGTIGQKRNDIIAIRYAKTSNGDLQKEAATLVAVKGTPSTGTPDDPETDSSDILSGATTAEMPLYRIPIDGVTVGTPVPLFDVLTPAAEVWDSVSQWDGSKTPGNGSLRLPSGLILNFGTYPANAMSDDRGVSGGYRAEVAFRTPYTTWCLPFVAADYRQGLPKAAAYRGTALDRITIISDVNSSGVYINWMAVGW